MERQRPSLRLDQLLVERGLVESRNKAQALIRAGKVLVSEVIIDKPGTTIKVDAPIRLKESMQFCIQRWSIRRSDEAFPDRLLRLDLCGPRRLHRWIYRLSLSAKCW